EREALRDEDVLEDAVVASRSPHSRDRPRIENRAMADRKQPGAQDGDTIDQPRTPVLQDESCCHQPARLRRAAHVAGHPREAPPPGTGPHAGGRRVEGAGDDRARVGEDLVEGLAGDEVAEEGTPGADRQVPARRAVEPSDLLDDTKRGGYREVS